MRIRRTFMLATVVAIMAAPAMAQVFVDVNLGAPPPVRYEPVPVARPGYVWAPGYWAYTDHDYYWREGRWIAERPGYVWVNDRWDDRDGRWGYSKGYWKYKGDNGKHKGWSKGKGKGHGHH